ncbi:MAG: PorT family protein [Bacteroidetes bacterium]|nr:PorT family protein [Bacteroidota bacterium]
MKKIFVLILAAMLIVASSNIQAQTQVSFGARAGLNIANFSFDPDVATGVTKSSRTGFKFGGALEVGFAPMFALQVEPMFSTGGSELSGQGGKLTFKTSSIEIPILFKVKIPVAGSVTPYAFVGPNLGFVLSSKSLLEAGGQSQETDMKDQTSSVNFALDFGAGAGFKVAPLTTILFDVRYSLGLTNMLNDKGKQSFGNDQSIKTTGFQIIAGVMFGLN